MNADHTNNDDERWDLTGLLETMQPPEGGLIQLHRRLRRWRWGRRMVTGVVVVGVVAVVVGFVAPGAGGGRRVVVAGPPTTRVQQRYTKTPPSPPPTGRPSTTQPAPPSSATAPVAGTPNVQPAVPTTPVPTTSAGAGSAGATPSPVPLVPPAPASAGSGWKPFDIGALRLWLPVNWYTSDNLLCQSTEGNNALQSTFVPCSEPDQADSQLVVRNLAPTEPIAGLPPTPAPGSAGTTVVNGLTVEEGFGSPATQQWYFPDLAIQLTATGSEANAIAATVQASPGEDVIAALGNPPSTVPTGWRHVNFDGLTFAVPASWPVHDPAVVDCSGLGASGPVVELGQPTSVPSCPAIPTDRVAVAEDGVSVIQGSDVAQGSGQPGAMSHPATTAGGAQLLLSVTSVGQSTVEATVTAGGKTFAVQVDVGKDPQVAWNILGSMASSAATAGTRSSSRVPSS